MFNVAAFHLFQQKLFPLHPPAYEISLTDLVWQFVFFWFGCLWQFYLQLTMCIGCDGVMYEMCFNDEC